MITLTTDFGLQDGFVGVMKGVILNIAPRALIVDLTHGVAAGEIRAGALALAVGYRYFPKGTVHVAVVDPGVGSRRNAIAVQTADYFFVGPDNGVLTLALGREKVKSVRRLTNGTYFLHPVSRTFHGRDIFAPVAAHLCRGTPIRRLGSELKRLVPLPWPEPNVRGDRIEGEVVFIDRFGNAVTNIENADLDLSCENRAFIGRKCLFPVKEYYQAVPAGRAVAVPGSTGFLEIAVNGGSAAKRFGLKIGDWVCLRQG